MRSTFRLVLDYSFNNCMDKIKQWQKLSNQITETWIRNYFEIEKDEELDYYWVAEDVGSILCFADYYINFNDILKCFTLNISREQFFNWYHYCLENQYVNISLSKYVLPEEKEPLKNKVKKH